MKHALLFLLSGIILCTSPYAVAQHEQAIPPPCLPVADAMLAPLVGAWDVDWTYRTAPGQFTKATAQSNIQLDLLGCVLTETFDGTSADRPFSAVTMISQKSEGIYDRVRIDSGHGAFTQSVGQVTGDSLVFEWQRDMGTRVLRTRHYFFDITTTSFTVAFYLSRQEGAPWELVERSVYRKKEEH